MKSISPNRSYWCDECQVPVLGPVCLACGNTVRDISSSSLRPVFSQEISYLESRFGPKFSGVLREGDTWVSPSNRVYFVDGKPVLQLHGLGKGQEGLSYKLINSASLETKSRSVSDTIILLHQANYHYLRELKYEAECFIKEMAKQYDMRTICVSFSGGKDSTVVSHLVMNTFGRSDILHIFADTTIEAPDTYKYLEAFKKKHTLTPIIYCKSPLDFFDIASEIGPPSRILRWCCTTHKTNPLGKIIGVLNPSAGVLAFDGVRKCESNRRSNYLKVSAAHKIGKEILASPILEWSDIQLWIYMLVHGLEINTAYAKGFRRVGCLYCPFNSNWSELLIRYYYPKESTFWTSFLHEHAQRIQHIDPEIYVQHGWRVRAGGRGLDSYKTVLDSYPCAISEDAMNYQLVTENAEDVEIFLRPFGNQILVHEDNHSKSFMIKSKSTEKLLASVEVSFEENTVRITYLCAQGKSLLRKRIEKQLRKLQSCIKCGACTAKCSAHTNPFEGISGIDSQLCVSCLKCVSFDCPVVDSLTRRGRG